jgi:hypothetical protein
MREVSYIPDGPGHYLVVTESGSWHYLDLDEVLVWQRIPGREARRSRYDYLKVIVRSVEGGWEVGQFGALTVRGASPAVTYTTSRIRGIAVLDEIELDPRIDPSG